MSQPRVPRGIPAGGQWSVGQKEELDSPFDSASLTPLGMIHGCPAYAFKIDIPQGVLAATDKLRNDGFEPLLVGGSVRDALLGKKPKDFDFEVQGASIDELVASLKKHGRVDEVGKQFGVLKCRINGHDIDFSVPRRENKVGAGHRGFEVDLSPLTVDEAADRRDFTINAMSYDPQREAIIDPKGGVDDLLNRRLRVVSDAFDEDPLRVLRGAQFAGRFGLTADEDVIARCRRLLPSFDELPAERVWGEWEKLSTKSVEPELALRILDQTGWGERMGLRDLADSSLFRQLELTAFTPSQMRREVFTALMMRRVPTEDRQRVVRGLIDSTRARQRVEALAASVYPDSFDATELRRQARTSRLTWHERLEFAYCEGYPTADELEIAVRRAGVLDGPLMPLVDGSDAIKAGIKPSPEMGMILHDIAARQDDGGITNRDEALAELARAAHTIKPSRPDIV